MITAAPTILGRWFWQTTARIGIKRQFRNFLLIDPVSVSPERSVLLIGNHISWWDGFLAMEANRQIWRKKFYVMMLEDQLEKRPFMRQTGAFSVKPGSRDVITSLQYAADLLADPRHIVLIFPQGKIHSQHDRSFRFGAGVERILRHCPTTQIVFFASFLDYGSYPTPTVRLYSQLAISHKDLTDEYRSFFLRVEAQHLEAVNE